MNVDIVYAVAAAVLTLVVAAALVREYAHPGVPPAVRVAVALAWALGFLGLLLLPLDTASVSGAVLTSGGWLVSAWRALYWSTFALAWLILPVMVESETSGELTWYGGVWSGAKATLVGYAWAAAAGVLVAAWLLATGRLSAAQLISVTMTAADAYGQALVALLGGYGLVLLPRFAWRSGLSSHTPEGAAVEAWRTLEAWEASRGEFEQLRRDLHHARSASPTGADVASMLAGAVRLHDGHPLACAARGEAPAGVVVMPDGARVPTPQDSTREPGPDDAVSLPPTEGGWGPDVPKGAVGPSRIRREDARRLLARAAANAFDGDQLVRVWVRLLAASHAGRDKRPATAGLRCAASSAARWLLVLAAVGASVAVTLSNVALPLTALGLDAASDWSPVARAVEASGSLCGEACRSAALLGVVAFVAAAVFTGLFSLSIFRATTLYRGGITSSRAMLYNAVYACRLQFSLAVQALRLTGWHHAGTAGAASATALELAIGASTSMAWIDALIPLAGSILAASLALGLADCALHLLGLPELSSRDEDNVRAGMAALEQARAAAKTARLPLAAAPHAPSVSSAVSTVHSRAVQGLGISERHTGDWVRI